MSFNIAVGTMATDLEKEAARVVAARINERISGSTQVIDDQTAHPLRRIVIGTPDSSDVIRKAVESQELSLPTSLGQEGYSILASDAGGDVLVGALRPHGVLYGLGKLLRIADFRDGEWTIPETRLTSRPQMPVRGIYFATHFGNWYTRCSMDDLQSYVEDLALWGVNQLIVWWDCHEIESLDVESEKWRRWLTVDGFARRMGMKVGRIVISNEGYLGQVPDELQVEDRKVMIFTNDICPSKPGGKEMILSNRREFFEAMPSFDSLWLWPYDSGGCNCRKCMPWSKTFMDLNREIVTLLRKTHPETEVCVSAWWFEAHRTGEDDAFFQELAKGETWFGSIIAGTAEAKRWMENGREVPDQYQVVLFPEISMFDSHPWGSQGANPAPQLFLDEIQALRPILSGAVPYSEGRYEDINKFVWMQLLWNPDADLTCILREYCHHYYGQAEVADLIAQLEPIVRGKTRNPGIDLVAERWEACMAEWATQGWRWQLIRARTMIHSAKERLRDRSVGPRERLEITERLRNCYEYLQSTIYLHEPGVTLDEWLHSPFEKVFADVL